MSLEGGVQSLDFGQDYFSKLTVCQLLFQGKHLPTSGYFKEAWSLIWNLWLGLALELFLTKRKSHPLVSHCRITLEFCFLAGICFDMPSLIKGRVAKYETESQNWESQPFQTLMCKQYDTPEQFLTLLHKDHDVLSKPLQANCIAGCQLGAAPFLIEAVLPQHHLWNKRHSTQCPWLSL